MPKKTKKFIDKKNAVTFHLVHRSQQDPLAADERAPQKVLLPVNTQPKGEKKKQIEEQHKFGIYFDDDYNYLQHLRDTSTQMEWEKVERIPAAKPAATTTLNLPSSVFASTVEEDVGLLNKAAPESGLRLDLDPDVIAAMDEDFDFDDPDNQLEDNFIELANAPASDVEYDAEFETSDVDSNFTAENDDEERDEVGSLKDSQFSFDEEETKSRFTQYSMSSSVIRRNQQLTLLDNRFEKMFAGYDENEIGALDCEEIEGHVAENSDLLLQCVDEFEKSRTREQLKSEHGVKAVGGLSSTESGEEELEEIEVPQKMKWDCESILSTYTDIYNHPKLIAEPKQEKIKVNMRTGIPVNVLGTNKLTAKALARLDGEFIGNQGPKSVAAESIISTLSTLSIRPKDESPEERRERKKLLKEYKRERRQEKKLSREMFKEEAKLKALNAVNNRRTMQGKIHL